MARFMHETESRCAEYTSAAFSCPFMSADGMIIIADTDILSVSVFVCLISLIMLLAKQLLPMRTIHLFSSPLIA